MEEDFLAKNNPCGQTLLQLVSRGNAVIAEISRLKDHIPPVFKLDNKSDQQKYGDIIHDFNYFTSSEAIDRKIEANENLQDISDELWEHYGDILERFYNAFESIFKYIRDLNFFLEEVDEGVYIQQNLDTIFLSEDGLQLMCESIYLYGVMLFLLEIYHTSPVRERLVVAYSRYKTADTLDHVCQLIRSTGFTNTAGVKRPVNYPQDLFRRISIDEKFLELVIGKLRTEDIYHQQKALPQPQHSTTAFAQQAAMLFVVLFFAPNMLHHQTARMREIVDKFFPDNWIVNIYMGVTVNLIELWEPFKAARLALANTLESSNIQEYAQQHAKNLEKLLDDSNKILSDGVLSKSYLMDNISNILCLSRDSNVTLRWLFLHSAQHHAVVETNKKCKQIRDQVISMIQLDEEKILQLLFNTAQYENKISDLFKSVLSERSENWETGKKESLARIQELIEIFAGNKQVMRVKKSESLRKWFSDISVEIDSLKIEEPNISARKIAQLIQALEEVQGFRQINNNLGVKQLVSETCDLLKEMLGAVNVRDTLLVNMQIIGDFSYGWILIDNFNNLIQERIKNDPVTVSRLRSVFLKLSSAMETPLLRINQADDGDLPSVSIYYSHQLLNRVRLLLQVIPRSVFQLMAQIALVMTNEIPELPTRLDKEKLRDMACLPARFKVAKMTHRVSVFSKGLINMKSTLVGIVRVDPRELLESGIRDELTSHIKAALDANLNFTSKSKLDLKSRLAELGAIMEGQRNSFEYVQDYIGINGVKMWKEELKNVIMASVEIECKNVVRKGIYSDLLGATFMGRLAKQLLNTIDPKSTFYVEQHSAWMDIKTKLKVADLDLFKRILKAVSVPGLVGLDRIISFIITKQLQDLVTFLEKEAGNNNAWLEMFGSIAKSLSPYSITVDQPGKLYPTAATRLSRLFSAINILDAVVLIGNLQILRKQISFTLNQSAKIHARNYTSSLLAVNEALLIEALDHEKDCSKPGISPSEISKVSELLMWVGANDPYATIYITCKNIPYISLFAFLFSSVHIPRFTYDKSLATLVCKRTGEGITPFVVGTHTLLKQFNVDITKQYVNFGCQFVKSYMLAPLLTGKQDVAQEALSMMQYLEQFISVGNLPRALITQSIPNVIVDLFRHGLTAFASC